MRTIPRPLSLLLVAALLRVFSSPTAASAQTAGECGGTVECECGDRVVEDYVLTENLGPCTWAGAANPDELIGLKVDSGVTLDCDGYSVIGPGDAQKEEFGVKLGSSSRPVSNATVRNCNVTGFWWGIYVTRSEAIVLEDNVTIANGWMSATENGTGYGIDVAQSNDVHVRRNQILYNGNEGIHLSASSGVVVEDNLFVGNGFEQVYIINADDNTITRNVARGGRQGLEMRDSDQNTLSYNAWHDSPKQWLENDNDQNLFVYDDFEGTLEIDDSSNANRFETCSFFQLADDCVEITAGNNVFFKSRFACKRDIDTSVPVTLDRSVGVDNARKSGQLTKVLLGCSADRDGDGQVGPTDLAAVGAAVGAVPGDIDWDSEVDLDHNGRIETSDLTIATNQVGACDFENRPAKPRLKRNTLVDNPAGQADLLQLDASASKDDHEGFVRFDFRVENSLTGEVLFEQALEGVAKEQAQVELTCPPGRYFAYLVITDDFGMPSKPARKVIGVD